MFFKHFNVHEKGFDGSSRLYTTYRMLCTMYTMNIYTNPYKVTLFISLDMSSHKNIHLLLISFIIYTWDLQDVHDGLQNNNKSLHYVHNVQFDAHDVFNVTLMWPSRFVFKKKSWRWAHLLINNTYTHDTLGLFVTRLNFRSMNKHKKQVPIGTTPLLLFVTKMCIYLC